MERRAFNRRVFFFASGALAVFLLGCSGNGKSKETLQLSGSSTMGPMISEIGKQFEKDHLAVRIDVQTGGSSRGIADSGSGLADIGMSSRKLTEKESKDYQATVIATDGIGILVHSSNPVKELSDKQLVGIFKGEITDWKEVGGTAGKIVFINRAAGRSELSIVSKHFGVKNSEFRPASIAGENQQGIKLVAANPLAITYMSVGASLFAAENQEKVKLLDYRSVKPDFETVSSGTYSLSRPLILVTKGRRSDLVRQFIEFCKSKAMHQTVKAFSYVPIQN